MKAKPHLNFVDQVLLLKNRGMQVDDEESAIAFLRQFNYYRFAEYSFAFLPKHPDLGDSFDFAGTSFSDVIALIEFDFALRTFLFEELSRFEIKLRTTLAYAGGYDDPIFHITGTGIRREILSLKAGDGRSHVEWVGRYKSKVQALSPEDMARNFDMENAAEIPIWGAVELMDLGQLSRLYRMTDQGLATRIAEVFDCTPSDLKSWIVSLNVLRNHVAHQSRIWNRRFTFPPKTSASKIPPSLFHLRGSNVDINLLYPRLAVLAWLGRWYLFGSDFKTGIEELMRTFPSHEAISPETMGFPSDWRDETLWK